MERATPPSWAEGDPGVLAEQFVNITKDTLSDYRTKYYALVAAIAAASIHNVLTKSPAGSRQQHVENIKATAAAVVQRYRTSARRGGSPDAARAQPTPAALQKLDSLAEQVLQQLQQQQQPEPQLITAAFEVYLMSLAGLDADRDDECADGSHECSFVCLWPLDGSAAAGADLQENSKWQTFKLFTKLAGGVDSLLGRLLQPGGAQLLEAQIMENTANREPPAPNSSPLALFVNSKPQAMYSSRAAQAAAEAAAAAAAAEPAETAAGPLAAPVGAEPGGSSRRVTGSSAAAAAAAGAAGAGAAGAGEQQLHSPMTDACCDIKVLQGVVGDAYVMHLDGDLLCLGYSHGRRGREPGFAGAVLGYLPQSPPTASSRVQQVTGRRRMGEGQEWGLVALSGGERYDQLHDVRHGLFSHVTRVCADAGSALMWCAGDEGRRIKGFRAPAELGGPKNTDAVCNVGEGNGMQLQYTLRSDGGCVGLHVIGTRVMSVTDDGELLSWDLSSLTPQARERQSSRAYMDSGEDSDEGSDGEGPIFKGDLGLRSRDNVDELECSKGVLPTLEQQLQLPNTKYGRGRLGRTCLLGSSCSILAASWDGVSPFQQASAVLTFDMQTQRATNAFMGHMWAVKALAAAPEAWPGSENLFATAAQSRDIKIWDVRCSGGAAAITLVSGGVDHIAPPFNAVVLAGNSGGSSGGGSSSSSSQLGAGLMCFAGGTCESVWAWDVRASSAQALYQLSTGNQEVTSLAWHAASNTLIANCESHYDWDDCKEFNPQRLQPGFMDAGEDEGYLEDEYIWPRTARHEPNDFRKYYTVVDSSVLAYTFSSRAAQVVPDVGTATFRQRL